jgi:subtilase family serine protease/flagellar hook assembly protein FlgD/fibronectin type 3 domain-containing protein
VAAALAAFVVAASAAAAQGFSDRCVDVVPLAKHASAAPKLVHGTSDVGNVTIVEYSGDYTRGEFAPREEIARRFYETHPDAYDFLVVFTTFEFDTGGALAFNNRVKNDVDGIGQQRYDHGAQFGSAGRLGSYIDMAALSRYRFDQRDARYENVLDTLAHEVMHQWGANVRYRDAGGATSDALLGEDASHWSYFLDSDASTMYGADWQRRPDGRYEAVAVRRRYSPLDLYVAGFAAAGEVPPMTLIRGGDGDANAIPVIGATSGGSGETVTIEQIVAANGVRAPSAADAPKSFRAAMLLIKRPGETVSPQTLHALEALRVRFQQRFAQMTDGRANIRIFTETNTANPPALPTVLQGSGDTTAPAGYAAAVAWLEARQAADGHWEDRPATALRDTAAVLAALEELAPASPAIARAKQWIASRTVASIDARAWQVLGTRSTADVAALAAAQADDGGWALADGFATNPFDTATAAGALAQVAPDAASIDRALAHLAPQQNADGSFGATQGGRGRILPTLRAARLLQTSASPAHQLNAQRAADWFDARVIGGGLGETSVPSLSATIEAYALVGHLPFSTSVAANARAFVRRRQQLGGDWGGSVYLTATAALASLRDLAPNLAIADAPVVNPAQPFDGERVRLSVAVANRGNVATSATVVRWYDGDPAAGGTPLGADVAIPVLVPGQRRGSELEWDTTGRSGARALHVVVDPDNTVNETSEADNGATLALTIAPPPAQPDLALAANDLVLDPSSVTAFPTAVRVTGVVRNNGLAAVAGARLVLAAASRPDVALAQATVDVPARGSATIDLAFTAADASALALVLSVDPDNAVAEAREDNNAVSLRLGAGQSLDLAIAPGDIVVAQPAVAGRDVSISVTVRNRGTLASPSASLRVEVVQGATTYTLLDSSVEVPAGGSVVRVLPWRATAAGTARVRVVVDGADQIAEADETNNAAQVDIDVIAVDGADLAAVPDSLAFTPTPALQGQPLVASLRVRNYGENAASPFVVALYAGDPRLGAPRIGTATVNGLAQGGDAVVAIETADLDAHGDVGLFVLVDADLAYDEVDEANNLTVKSLRVRALPDISVSLADVALTPALPVTGEPVVARVTVRNLGEQDAHDVVVRLAEGDAAQSTPVGERTIASLPAGGTGVVEWTWTLGLQPDARAIVVAADPNDAVREVRDDNNRAVLPFDVQNGDLYASEGYVSPNGDGVRDETAIVFRLAGSDAASVRIVNGLGYVVRTFASLVPNADSRGQIVWDGRDDRGRIVVDGDYRAQLYDAAGQPRGEVLVVVDTNRSSVFEAIGTPHAIESRALFSGGVPPAASSRSTYQFGLRTVNGATGLYRSDTLLAQYEAVVSRDWAATVGASIDGFVFSPDGSEVAFWTRGANARAYRADAAGIDAVTPLQTDEDMVSRSVVGYFDDNEILLRRGTTAASDIVDKRTRALRPFRNLPATSNVTVTPWGVLARDPSSRTYVRFLPRDMAQPVIELVPNEFVEGRYYETQVSSDRSRVLLHTRTPTQESLELVDLASGTRRLIVERPNDAFASTHFRDVPGGVGSVRELAFRFVEARGEIAVVDGRARTLSRHADDGTLLGRFDLPATDRNGPYALDPQQFLFVHGFDAVDPHPHCRALPEALDDARRFYDPSTDALFVRLREVVGVREFSGSEDFAAYYDGVARYTNVNLDTGVVGEFAAGSALPLTFPYDVQRFPLLPTECPGRLPATWPDLILRDGARLLNDGRIQSPSRGIARDPWRGADKLAAVWPDENRLTLTTNPAVNVTSLLNGYALVAAVESDYAFVLSGVAADRNFDRYELDYASSASPGNWQAIVPASNDEVHLDEFVTWMPPAAGTYTVRLRVFDRAGNVSTATTTLAARRAADIDRFELTPRYFSPNADGVQDRVDVRFRALRPVALTLVVKDESGAIVYHADHAIGTTGPQALAWDGRDQGGARVPDGRYRIELGGFGAWVVVDTVAPTLTAALEPMYPPFFEKKKLTPMPELVATASDANTVELKYETISVVDGNATAPPAPFYGKLLLSMPVYATSSYRVTASDPAGNRTVRAVDRGEPIVVMWSTSRLTDNAGVLGFPRQPLPWNASTLAQFRGDSAHIPIDGDLGDATRMLVLAGVDAIARAGLQYAPQSAPDDWSEPRLYTPTYGVCLAWPCSKAATESLNLAASAVDLENGGKYFMRAVVERDDGSRAYSNAVPASVGGISAPMCFFNKIFVKDYNAGTLRGATIDIVRKELDVVVSRHRLEADFYLPDEVQFTYAFRLGPGVVYEMSVTAFDAGGRKFESTGTCVPPPEGNQDIGEFNVGVLPVIVDRCDGAPSNRVTLEIRGSVPRARGYRWRYVDGVTAQMRTIPVPWAPTYRDRFDVDTQGWPVGTYDAVFEADFAPEGSGPANWRPLRQLQIPIETVAPQIAITSPDDNAPMCANRLDAVVGSIVSPSVSAYRVSIGEGAAPSSWTCLAEKGLAYDPRQPPCALEFDSQEPRAGFNGSSVVGQKLWERAANAPLTYDGLTTLKVTGVNWSGGTSCATRMVRLDGAVELDERARSPQAFPLAGDTVIAIAPDSNGLYRQGQWRLRAGETLAVTARVYPTGVSDPAPLATFADLASVSGDFDVEWDGRAGGVVVADGEYEIRVDARDACGQDKTLTWRAYVKNTPPAVAFAAPAPDTTIAAAVVDVRGTASDPLLARWSLDVLVPGSSGATPIAGGITSMLASGGVAPQLAAWSRGRLTGSVTLRLSARDVFGNVATATLPLVLDTPAAMIGAADVVPPLFSPNGDGVLDAVRAGLALQRDARVAVRVRNVAQTVVATLFDGPAASGSHGYPWDGRNGAAALPDGDYAIVIDATDAQGVLPPEQAVLSATIDSTAPAVALIAPTTGFVRPGLSVRFSVDDVHLAAVEASLTRDGSVIASLNDTGGGVLALAMPAGAGGGAYALRVDARDGAGNRTVKTFAFAFDGAAPVVELSAPTDRAVLAAAEPTRVRGTVRDDNIATYTLSIAPDTTDVWQTLATGTNAFDAAEILAWTPNLADGDYRLRLRADDKAGNAAEVVRLVTIDGTPPVAAIVQPVDDAFVRGAFEVKGSATDAHFAEYRLALIRASALPNGTWSDVYIGNAPVDAALLAKVELAQPTGDYVLRLTVKDRAGLASSAQVRVRFDAQPPPTPLELTGRVEDHRHARLAWRAVAAPDLAGYVVYRGGARIATVAAGATQHADNDAPEGTLRYTVTAIDEAGNESAPSNAVDLVVDHTAPQTALARPLDGERVRGLVDIVGTAWSRDDFHEYRLILEPLDPPGSPRDLRRSPLAVQSASLAAWNTLDTADETRMRVRLTADDRSGNVANASIEVIVDNLPPAAPTGVAAALATSPGAPCAALGGGARDLRVCWNANTESDLLGYLVYRDGVLLGAPLLPPPDLRPFALRDPAWLDADIADGVHVYVIHAIDRAGNVSAPSDAVELPPLDFGPPDLDFVAPQTGAVFDRRLDIHATSAHRDIAQVQFAYRRVGDAAWTDLGAAVTAAPYRAVWTPGALPFGDYDLRGIARDEAGNVDPTPPVVRVKYADLTPPDAPTALTARSDGATVSLAWSGSKATDVAGYEISRYNGQWWEIVDGTPTTALAHDDTDRADGEWRYRVVAVDAYGNRSESSNDAAAPVFGMALAQPFTPTRAADVAVQGKSGRAGTLSIRVENAQGANDLAPVATGGDGAIALPALGLAPGANRFVFRVADAQGNRSRAAELWIDRGAAPAAPQGVAANVAGYDVTVSWNANAEPDVVGYRVSRRDHVAPADAALGETPVATSIEGYAPEAAIDGDPQTAWETTHEYGDAIENDASDPALELSWPTPRIIVAANLTWLSTDYASANVDLQGWSGHAWITLARVRGGATDGVLSIVASTPYRTDKVRLVVRGPGRAGYFDYRVAEFALIERPLVGTTTLTQTLPDGRYEYRVSAVNAYGFESALSEPALAEVGDATPPDAVELSGTLAGNTAQLSWTASAAADVTRYVLRRDGTVIADVAANAPRAWTDAGLPNGVHTFVVVAVDAFDNESAASNTVTLTVANGGPGIPANVRVVAPPQGATLDLAWEAGPGAAPAVYVVRRATMAAGPFVEIARIATTMLRDTPLANGTAYHYTVEAIDAFGNAGGPSAPVSGTPRDVQPPLPPLLTYPTTADHPLVVRDDTTFVCGFAESDSRVVVARDGFGFAEVTAAGTLTQTSLVIGQTNGTRMLPAPDGRHYALDTFVGRISIGEAPTGAATVVTNTGRLARWAPHGLVLYYADVDTGAIHRHALDGDARVFGIAITNLRAFAISPDETRILFAGDYATSGTPEPGLWIANVDGTQARRVEGADDVDVYGLWFSADGRYALAGTTDSVVEIDADAARVQGVHAGDGSLVSWSPDGRYVYARHRDEGGTDVIVRSVIDGTSRVLFDGFNFSALSWSPDASRILAADSEHIDIRDALDGRSTLAAPLVDAGSTSAQWTASGRIMTKADFGPLRLIDPPGTFCTGTSNLVATRHVFDATARDASGNASLPAAPVEVLRAAATLPDLAIGATDILFVPVDARPGDVVTALVVLRNTGSAPAAASAIAAQLVAPDGATQTLVVPAAPPLGAGETHTFSLDLGVLGAAGNWRLRITVDAQGQLVESNENNNRAEAQLAVVADGAPQLDVQADRALYAPGEAVTGEVAVSGAITGARVAVAVIDATGSVVDALGDYPVGTLARGQRWTQAVRWNAAGVFAGDYRLRARLVTASGATLAERTGAFAIARVRHIALTVAPETTAATVGTTVRVRSTVAYADGNAPLDGARLVLVALAPGGTDVTLADQPLGTLLPGYEVRKEDLWNTAGLAAGAWGLKLRLVAPGYESVAESSITLDAAAPTIAVAGALALSPVESLAAGFGGELRYTLANRGDVALAGVVARVRVTATGSTTPVAQTQQTFDVAAGSSASGALSLAAPPLALVPHGAVLEARLPGDAPDAWRVLARLGFGVVDATPPELTVLAPANGVVQPAVTMLRAAIIDRHSSVAAAQFRIDGGAWQPLGVGADGHHARGIDGLADGTHRLVVRARDAWGNETTSDERTFDVDATPPAITIDGVADGAFVNHTVTPIVTIVEAHPGVDDVRLDGAPYMSDTLVDTDGEHLLSVRSTDAAGNVAQRVARFTIDRVAPTVVIASPANGAVVAQSTVSVIVNTEPAAVVSLAAGAWQSQATADAAGVATFASVPLAPGDNTVAATARDRAGNTGGPASVAVRYETQSAALVGTVQPGVAELPHGDTLAVTLNAHNPGAVSLPGQRLRVRVAAGAQVLAEAFITRDFAADETFTTERTYASTSWPLGAITVTLDVDRAGTWTTLDAETVSIVDRSLPTLAALAPAAGSVLRAPVTVRAAASDTLSGVASVEARIDAGTWNALTATSTPGEYASAPLALAEGDRSVELRATDGAGNVRTLAPLAFAIDETPPLITIAGVADGDIVAQTVTPAITVTDTHPDTTTTTLDGSPYVSGTLIGTDGVHVLHVAAVDRAGNASQASVTFTIDRVAPAVVITSPADGITVSTATIAVTGTTEPLAKVQVAVGTFAATVFADANGAFAVAAANLQVGANTIAATATDRAGNVGTSASVTVTYVPVVSYVTGEFGSIATIVLQGATLDVPFLVRNPGTVAVESVPVRVRLYAVGSTSAAATYDTTVSLASQASQPFAHGFDTSALVGGDYRLTLEALQGPAGGTPAWRQLAQATTHVYAPCRNPALRPDLFADGFDPVDHIFCDGFDLTQTSVLSRAMPDAVPWLAALRHAFVALPLTPSRTGALR